MTPPLVCFSPGARPRRKLVIKWHPDKHPHDKEAATARFLLIQKAYDSLMTTDEEAAIEALAQSAHRE